MPWWVQTGIVLNFSGRVDVSMDYSRHAVRIRFYLIRIRFHLGTFAPPFPPLSEASVQPATSLEVVEVRVKHHLPKWSHRRFSFLWFSRIPGHHLGAWTRCYHSLSFRDVSSNQLRIYFKFGVLR